MPEEKQLGGVGRLHSYGRNYHSNAFDREGKTHDDREKQYMRTIKGYNQGEQQIFRNCLPYWWKP